MLRLRSYKLGLQETDFGRVAKLATLLQRSRRGAVHLVCLQETVPYVKQSYSPNREVTRALLNSPYAFFTGGNCSTGVLRGAVEGEAVSSFPGSKES
eukprot:3374792-Alexandrium_andersonii.AAC.1